MLKKSILIVVLSILYVGAQTSDYITVEIPIGAKSATSVNRVKWVGAARTGMPFAPDSGRIYFSRNPGGSNIKNYTDSIINPYIEITKQYNPITQDSIAIADTIDNNYIMGVPPSREIAFRASDQDNMGVGVYYCIVGWKALTDTFVSNEFQVIIESQEAVSLVGPTGKIEELTPTFSWKANTGVPYYHIILSDDIIKIDSAEGEVDLQGLSIIWQAITPNNFMVYGAPDPSGTITADPPPLSPGQSYTWIVLNNYGNHAAFTSARIGSPGEFTLTGLPLKAPVCTYPINVKLNSNDNKTINFKWTNLDTNANTYQLYLYIASEFEGINAQLVVYQTEVMAVDNVDTLSVDIEAASVLTTNKYTWRAVAIDEKGAGTVGDTVSFNYSVPVCTLKVVTLEQIRVGSDITTSPVGLVEIKVEVLDGSLEAPLLYYTDLNGRLSRERPIGSFRVTAKKDGYDLLSKTMNIKEGEVRRDTFFLVRPEATIYGKVIDEGGKGINLATVVGVSDQGDTVTGSTDALGNFVLNCYPADWQISANMTGYKSVLPSQINVISGENYSYGSITLQKNPFTLSGIVNNSSGTPVLASKVRIYQDGTLINEIPSTPQSGAFSFSIPAGTYTLTCEKTGFSSYTKQIDVLSSRSVTITMQPGASLITGYIKGKTWIDTTPIYAPITNATVKFVNITRADSFTVVSDNTYGDFKISLPGAQTYLVFSSAQNFTSRALPCTLVTEMKTTQVFMDTLQGLGMIKGEVRLSTDGSLRGNVNINCISTTTSEVIASGKTSALGYFEISSLQDGKYAITAGADGLVLDSIAGPDTVTILGGKATPSSMNIYMGPGTKSITWTVADADSFVGTIKLQSPLVKTLQISDTLKNAGQGSYVLSCDALSSSIIDLSYHKFVVSVDAIAPSDTLKMDIVHTNADTLTPVDGLVAVEIQSVDSLDSVYLYYKDAIWNTYAVKSIVSKNTKYAISIVPPKDGSHMQYYFKAWRGWDVYGYDKEVFSSYIAPDLGSLSKLEIVPSSEDTLSYPMGYSAKFSLKGYYSSAFIPGAIRNPESITWQLTNAQGCILDNNNDTNITVTTGSVRAFDQPVLLTVTIDTTKIRMIPGAVNTIVRPFRVSGAALKKIVIKRVDAGSPNPITTSPTDKAEFKALGSDGIDSMLTITPEWSIDPVTAGTISSNGVFKPAANFIGNVRIFAQALGIAGEYTADGSDVAGLNVQFMVTHKSVNDTARSKSGCQIVFPAGVVKSGDIGIIDMSLKELKNKVRRTTGLYKTIDSTAFEIQETENISFDFSSDSIRLILDVPENYMKSNHELFIARWSEDSLMWDILSNSVVASDRKTVVAALTHFSAYSIVVKTGTSMVLQVKPNPFSPFVKPEFPMVPYAGTKISFQLENKYVNIPDIRIRIFNVVGDLVWSMLIQNGNTNMYNVWWDGRTSNRELNASGNTIYVKGDKMCRNGRYFVVVSAKDATNKEYRLMKHIVLMK